jgi:hypothetical protein
MNMKKAKVWDESMGVRNAWARSLRVIDGVAGPYMDGDVGTPHGFVHVYHEWADHREPVARLDVCRDGRMFMRNYSGRRYTEKALVTMASRFAREIAGATK